MFADASALNMYLIQLFQKAMDKQNYYIKELTERGAYATTFNTVLFMIPKKTTTGKNIFCYLAFLER